MVMAMADGARSWVERDAAVVWHGFTQMAAYADNAPIVVDRAEGHYLYRRRGSPLPRRDLVAVGHHARPPRPRARRRAARADRPRRPHAMLGNGNRVTVELAEALAVPCRSTRPHFLVRVRRRQRRGAGAQDRVPVLGQPRRRGARPTYLAPRRRLPRRHDRRRSPWATAASAPTLFDPLRFPVVRARRSPTPAASTAAVPLVAEHAPRAGRGDRRAGGAGRRGCSSRDPADGRCRRRRAAAPRRRCSICDEVATGFGRTGTLVRVRAVRHAPRPACASARASPAATSPMSATVASGRVSTRSSATTSGARTLYHGHSYSGNALAAAVALRHLELLDEWDVLRQRAGPGRPSCARLLTSASPRRRPWARCACAA